MEKLKKIIKKISLVDVIILLTIIIALLIGYITFKQIRQTSDKQIVSSSKVMFHVVLRGISYTGTEFPVKKGEKAFITIRNVPYTELNIREVFVQPRKTAVYNGKDLIVVNDPAYPNMYDSVVIIEDDAKITKDGAVVGGNKLKSGLPVTIEGSSYKFNGTVSDVIIQNSGE